MAKVVPTLWGSAVALCALIGQMVAAIASTRGSVVLTGTLVVLHAHLRANGGASGPVEDGLTLAPFAFGLAVMRSLDTRTCASGTGGGIYHLCL